MGYYINTINVDFEIVAEKLDSAYSALCELNSRDELKTGRTFCVNPSKAVSKPESSTSVSNSPNRHFSWMEWNYDEIYDTVEEILSALGFDCYIEDNGSLRLFGYDGKSGDEEHFFEAVAPYVTPGSFVEWQGEEEVFYRWEFDGTSTMKWKYGEIVWN